MRNPRIRLLAGSLCCMLSSVAHASRELSLQQLFNMDIAELGQVDIQQCASVTPTPTRLDPASVTSITQSMITAASARNLFDLLEIYVPDFHYLPHHWEAPHMGMRGIISDRDDKYLLLVNGKVMNERTHYGALSERDLPMLADIRRIDVIRGPGSVIYGPGAVSMVINIQTEDYSHNDGDALVAKWGMVEQFRSLEIKKAIPLGDNRGMYLYAGISDYPGASQQDSPVVYGINTTTTWGQPVYSGEDSSIPQPDNHAEHRGQPKLKLHLNYQQDNFDAWFRYTRGGEDLSWSHKVFADAPFGLSPSGTQLDELATNSVGYEQLTLSMNYKDVVDDHMWVDYRFNADSFDYERTLFNNQLPANPPENHREESLSMSATANWIPSSSQALALGISFSHDNWGITSRGYPDTQAVSFVLGDMPHWSTNAFAILAEHQWQLTHRLTSFLGLRMDKDEYTDAMYSPRWALVYAPDQSNTYKFILNRSLRKNNAEELRDNHDQGIASKPEQLTGVELVYDHNFQTGLHFDTSLFYNDIHVIGIDTASLKSIKVADYSIAGVELVLSYKSDDWRVDFSHSYTQLQDFNAVAGVDQIISASQYGYGNDLSQWSDHITKLSATWGNDQSSWRLNGSLRVFWDYPGSRDFIDWSTETGATDSPAYAAPGYHDSTGASAFLDLGARYRFNDNSSVDFRGYNLLGLLDNKYNKRLFVANVGDYRVEAVSYAINYTYRF